LKWKSDWKEARDRLEKYGANAFTMLEKICERVLVKYFCDFIYSYA